MGRPSLKNERAAEILAAYESCVARFGIDGATLERVADEAGLARPLIRHNVGNRDDLLQALIDRFFAQSFERAQSMLRELPEENPAEAMVDRLFSGPSRDHKSVLVAEALIAAAATRAPLAKRMRQWLDDYVQTLATALRAQFPKAPEKDVQAAAAGIIGIHFNVDSMAMLGSMPDFETGSRAAALMLVAALED